MPSPRVRRILGIIEAWQRRLRALAEADAKTYEKIARTVDTRILRIVRRASTPTEALSEMRGTIANGTRAMVVQADRSMLEVLAESIDRESRAISAAYGVSSVSQVRVARVVETFERFEEAIRSREILRTLVPYRERWAGEWADSWTPAVRRIQAEFTRAALTGTPTNAIVEAITGDLGTLSIAGKMEPEAFARAFTRTKFTELNADFAAAIGRRAGLTQFVNFGVPDDRQSQECFEASNAGAKTLEEWDSWRASNGKGGRPPRHGFY